MFRTILILTLKLLARERGVVRAAASNGRVSGVAAKYFIKQSEIVKQLKPYL